MIDWLKKTLWDDPFQKWFLAVLFAINAAGSVYGYYWYRLQLAREPVYLWPFVTDSPLSSTLFTAALLLMLLGKRVPWFELWACTAVIKYGVWAMVVIGDFWLQGGAVTITEAMLWLSHAGMALEGFLFLRHLKLKPAAPVVLGLWMLFNDYLDYGWGLHPYLFAPGQDALALVTAVGLSILLALGTYLFFAARAKR